MKEPLESHFEGTLYRALADVQGGKPGAIGKVYELLVNTNNRPIPDSALPALISILTLQKIDIQIAASVALYSMRERALGAVPALRTLAVSSRGEPANAAICALGGIPGKESAQALLEILETCMDGASKEKAVIIITECARRAADFQEHVARLEETLGLVLAGEEWRYKSPLDTLRQLVRQEQSLNLDALNLPTEVNIQQALFSYQKGEFEGILPVRELPSGVGVILDERFSFRVRFASEVGLQIHRHPRDQNRYLIVLSNDGDAFGDQLSLVFEDVASAIREIYALRGAEITWVERNTPSSGNNLRETIEHEHVTFERDNPTTRWLSGPEWQIIRSFEKFLTRWQGGKRRSA